MHGGMPRGRRSDRLRHALWCGETASMHWTAMRARPVRISCSELSSSRASQTIFTNQVVSHPPSIDLKTLTMAMPLKSKPSILKDKLRKCKSERSTHPRST